MYVICRAGNRRGLDRWMPTDISPELQTPGTGPLLEIRYGTFVTPVCAGFRPSIFIDPRHPGQLIGARGGALRALRVLRLLLLEC